jgi:CRISPR-associated protein csx8
VEFDFIPFAFSQSGSSIFINNNTSIKYLLQSNGEMNYFLKQQFENQKTWNSVFYSYSEGAGFIDYDVEVIVKNMETDYYESMFIRQPAIKIFKNIADNRDFSDSLANVFKRHIKVNDNYYINVMQEVTDSILNELSLDDLIERLMKLEYDTESNTPETFCLSRLIYINEIIYKNMEGNMEKTPEFKGSSAAASQVVQYFISNRQENKIKGYQQRLANTLISKDYDRFVEIMLQLSSYTEVPFVFMHKLIQDFEANKNLAYNFINSLIISSKRKDDKGNQEEE